MHFVVIEGLDGSGKSTQLELLKQYLDKENIKYKYLHFPRLEQGVYGQLVARFLRGEMGANDGVDPYLVALIFAGDRSDAASTIRDWIEDGYLVILDRYVYSNIAFQCAKLEKADERERLRDWILALEFERNRIPRPDINLFLNVPFSFTQDKLKGHRIGEDRDYLKGERDIHEEDLGFQERVRHVYLDLQEYVSDLRLIDCVGDDQGMLPPEKISERIIDNLDLK